MSEETKDTTVDETAGLKAKVKELHGIIKNLQSEKESEQAAREEAEAEAAAKAGDVNKLREQLEAKHKKEIDTLKSQNEQLSNDLRTIRVDNEISQIIAKSGVIAAHVPAVEALLLRKVEYAEGQASIEGKSISDWATSYFAKDGAIYRPAPNNSGGDAMGNDGSKGSTHNFTRENINERIGEWAILAKSNPDEAKAIAVSVGRKDLAEDL